MDTSETIETMRAQAAKVVASGILGRSRFYASLLEYLVECAAAGRTPKELEIAAEVFGRGGEFDPSQDSMVRVYAHNLRQKLNQFYTSTGSAETLRLSLAKGEYRLAVGAVDAGEATEGAPAPRPPLHRGWMAGAAFVVLGVGVAIGTVVGERAAAPAGPENPYAQLAREPMWSALFDDDLPILVVVGDYYIFGELDEAGNVDRLVRDFSINSSNDLDNLLMFEPDLALRYMDLDLTYLPRGTAFALRDVLRVLYTSPKSVRTISMSELNVADFKTSHVVYLGYISALDKLLDFVLASSSLTIGATFDELVDRKKGVTYTSGAGFSADLRNYRDYALVSTFPGPNGNQFMIVAGTRDAGLMHAAQVLSESMPLQFAEQAAGVVAGEGPPAVELLFEVMGYDRTNLDATIVHTAKLDYQRIWGGELLLSN